MSPTRASSLAHPQRLIADLRRELVERTAKRDEALKYQTATSDVLKVISRSVFDLDTVLQTVVSTAMRLCRADTAIIYRNDGGEYRWVAGELVRPEYEERERQVSIRPGSGTVVGRAAFERRTVQILDAWTDPLYEAKENARIGGVHTMVGVPLVATARRSVSLAWPESASKRLPSARLRW
jgi:two-component system, NtrC family, sensor kinase